MGIGQPCRIPRQAMKWPDSLVGQVAALGLRRRCAGGDDCAAIWGNYCLSPCATVTIWSRDKRLTAVTVITAARRTLLNSKKKQAQST